MNQKCLVRLFMAGMLATGVCLAKPNQGESGAGVSPPYPLLNPPQNITIGDTRGFVTGPQAPRVWKEGEYPVYLEREKWFHEAKYGVFFHFLASGGAKNWTSEEWNAWVDAVDVDAVADQCKESGAGYVFLTLGQNHQYACAPNPVMDKLWNLQPGQYNSRRDLPMDLCKALEKRGIPMMLYLATDNQHCLPRPKGFNGRDRFAHWIQVAQWWSDHYGKHCKGWWVDGSGVLTETEMRALEQALHHGNPDALVGLGRLKYSDYMNGHCVGWEHQRTHVKPFWGQWDPESKIQWHALLHLGPQWGSPGTPKPTGELVEYAADIIKGGGVITFDLGAFTKGTFYGKNMVGEKNHRVGPYLRIQDDQMAQLRAVRDALRDIPVSDGKGEHARE